MSSSSSRIARILVSAAVAAAISGTAVAQAQLEEITVTARKRAESLQEVPVSVTAFTAEAIQSKGIRNVADIVKYTTGLSFDKGFAPQDTRPNIRGLPTTRGRPQYNPNDHGCMFIALGACTAASMISSSVASGRP